MEGLLCIVRVWAPSHLEVERHTWPVGEVGRSVELEIQRGRGKTEGRGIGNKTGERGRA